MFPSLRSALLICAALTATSVAPASEDDQRCDVLTARLRWRAFPKVPFRTADPARRTRSSPVTARRPSGGRARRDRGDEPIANAGWRRRGPTTFRSRSRRSQLDGCPASQLPIPAAANSNASPSASTSDQERAARRPARGRPSHRQPREFGGRFPSTYCGVLFQRGQFSFVRGRSWPRCRAPASSGRPPSRSPKIIDQDLHQSCRSATRCSSTRATSRRAGA